MQIACPTHLTPGDMGSGNRNKVFFLPFLDQILLQPLDSFHEMFVFRNFILKLDDRLTYPHRAPLKMLGYINYQEQKWQHSLRGHFQGGSKKISLQFDKLIFFE
jgi:hypothetical protein